MFAKGDKVRDAGLTTPDYVERFDNIQYGPYKKWNMLDLYLPKNRNPEEKLPVIVSVHGGAWVYGDKELYQFYCMSLTQYGFAVVNFTYGLAPKFKFPQPLIDTNLVMNWILKNGQQYNLDTENIFAVGDSAGANDLSLYAVACTNPEYKQKIGIEVPENLKLRGIALNCGKYDLSLIGPDAKNQKRILRDYLKGKITQEKIDLLNATKFLTEAYPPVYLMTCPGDFLVNQAPIMEKALIENEIKHIYKIYGSKENPLFHVFHLDMRNADGAQCNKDECDFFASL